MNTSNTLLNAVQIPSREKVVELFKQYFFNRTDRICLDLRPAYCVCPHDPRNPSELDELIAAHVFGKPEDVTKYIKSQEQERAFPVTRIGSYTPNTDSRVKWICIDIDGGDGHAMSLKNPLSVVTDIHTNCKNQNIPVHIELSKSGSGYHLWFLFSDFVEASVARRFGYSVCPEELLLQSGSTISAYTNKGLELYPKCNTLRSDGTGVPILLPWNFKNDNGCTLFHEFDDNGQLKVIESEINEFQTIDVDMVSQIAEAFVIPELETKTKSLESLSQTIKEEKDIAPYQSYYLGPLVQTILRQLNLNDVYGDLLTGSRSGQWLGCRDPQSISGDQNPSAGVADGRGRCTKGSFHSFITGKTISIFDFLIQNGEAYSYTNAVEVLAEKAGVALQKGELLIEEMNKRYFRAFWGNEYITVQEKPDNLNVHRPYKFLKNNDFKSSFENRFIKYEKNEKTACDTWADFWLKHPNHRKYDDIVFKPGGCKPNEYNLYKGFAVHAIKGKCDLYLNHIYRNVCQENQEVFEYVYSWMAYCVQFPEKRPETALVLRGRMGTGKGIFAKYFGALFGDCYEHLSNPDDLVGQFNPLIENKLVVFLDEKVCTNDKKTDSQLKVLVTEDRIQIQQKYKNKQTVDNYLKIIMASNEAFVIPTDIDERRFVILEMGDRNIQDKEFFGKLIHQMENGGLEALLYELLHFDIKIDLRTIPQTKELMNHKIHDLPPIAKFWCDHLEQGKLLPSHHDWVEELLTNDLYQLFKTEFPKEQVVNNQFGTQLRKFCSQISNMKSSKPMVDMNGKIQATGSRIYRIPDLKKCRHLFEEAIHAKVEWEDEMEAVAAPQVNVLVDMNQLFPNRVNILDGLTVESPFYSRFVLPSNYKIIYSNN